MAATWFSILEHGIFVGHMQEVMLEILTEARWWGNFLHDASDLGFMLYVMGVLQNFKVKIDLIIFVLQRSCWYHKGDRSQGKRLGTRRSVMNRFNKPHEGLSRAMPKERNSGTWWIKRFYIYEQWHGGRWEGKFRITTWLSFGWLRVRMSRQWPGMRSMRDRTDCFGHMGN